MNKATIIFGHRESGKREKAEEIAKGYNHVVRISVRGRNLNENMFLFSEVTEETDLIIIDDLLDDHDFDYWIPRIFGEITVNKKMQYPFTRETPRMLFIIDKKPDFTGSSLTRRFDLLECQRPIPARYLSTGMHFKLPKQRKFRTVANIIKLNGDGIPDAHKGMLLVVDKNCKQMIIDPEQEVIISNQ